MKKILLALAFTITSFSVSTVEAGFIDEIRKFGSEANQVTRDVNTINSVLGATGNAAKKVTDLLDTLGFLATETVPSLTGGGINVTENTYISSVCQDKLIKATQCLRVGATDCSSLSQQFNTCYAQNVSGGSYVDTVTYNQSYSDALDKQIIGGESVRYELPECSKFSFCRYSSMSLRDFLLNIVNFALSFLGLIAVAMIIYAGYLYVVSMGDDGNAEKAKKIILYAAIGILVILGSYAIVNTIVRNAASGGEDRDGVVTNNYNLNQTNYDLGNGDLVDPNSLGSGNNSGSSIIQALNNPIVIGGNNVQDAPASTITTLESAKEGLVFKMNVLGIGIFDFGDGTQGLLDNTQDSEANLVHVYGADDTYNVRLVVETETGETSSFSKSLTIGGVTANFNFSKKTPRAGESIVLDGGASNAKKGTIRDYSWSCAGGDGCFGATSGEEVEVIFTQAGTYQVTLQTTGSVGGLTGTTKKEIVVYSEKPEANFSIKSADNSARPGQYEFDARQSLNVSGGESSLTYNWSFDGEFERTTSPEIKFDFKTVGEKQVELIVTQLVDGKKILSESLTKSVTVDSVVPANFDITQDGAIFDIDQ